MKRVVSMLIVLFAALSAPSLTQAGPPASFTTENVVGGFVVPTAFAEAPDGRIFIAEKSGLVWVFDGADTHLFLDIRDETNEYGDRGLLGLALDPAFGANETVYLFHIEESDPGNPDSPAPTTGEVFRIQATALDPSVADPATRVTLLAGFDNHHYSHSGGCLRFDTDGRLLASFGDGSSYEAVDPLAVVTYDLDSLVGKLVRVDPASGDGVPDNPYFDAGDPSAVRSKVLARGFRNPFRFGIDPSNGDVYVGDVGWYTWEEVNRVPMVWTDADRDLNFGWPCYEGVTGVSVPMDGYRYDPSTAAACEAIYLASEGGTGIGAEGALYAYSHGGVGGESGSSVTAGVFYQGGDYPAEYIGRFFFGDYARNRFQTMLPDGSVEDFGSPGDWGNPVDIQLGSDGNVRYLAIGTGELRQIRYVGGNRPPVAVATAAPLAGPVPLKVRFDGRSSFDPDDDRVRFSWDFGDASKLKRGRRPGHKYKVPGTFLVTLTVSDRKEDGLTDSTSMIVNAGNTPPAIAFVTPLAGTTYGVGETLPVELVATDVEDGALSGASVTWRVLLHHLGHLHYLPLEEGTSGSFVVPDHGADSFISIVATATDSLGAETTTEVTPTPE
jgi:glucose/arabinose dehydrogenase